MQFWLKTWQRNRRRERLSLQLCLLPACWKSRKRWTNVKTAIQNYQRSLRLVRKRRLNRKRITRHQRPRKSCLSCYRKQRPPTRQISKLNGFLQMSWLFTRFENCKLRNNLETRVTPATSDFTCKSDQLVTGRLHDRGTERSLLRRPVFLVIGSSRWGRAPAARRMQIPCASCPRSIHL